MDSDDDTSLAQYKHLNVEDKNGKDDISLYAKTSYQEVEHVSRVKTDERPNSSRRDLFSARIDENHHNEELRGQKVYIKKIALTRDNELQCWREMMIGLELKHDLIVSIVDNWIEVVNGDAANAYYVTMDRGTSIKKALKDRGQLRREPGQNAPIHFEQFLKIAHDLVTTLIILKKNNVLHRDINTSNILIHELNNMSELRTELIDFGWAKKIAINTATTGVGTAGKNAPEITLKDRRYSSKIAGNNYSYPVDVYGLGQALIETLEADKGFFKTFIKVAGFTKTANESIDEGFGATLFHLLAKKPNNPQSYAPMSDLSEEQRRNMIDVNPACKMPDPQPYKEKLERFLAVPGNTHGIVRETDSISQRFLRNFWFRRLDKNKGWTDERIDLVVDLIMKMLNYWPDDRITCEQLYEHDIFKEMDEDKMHKHNIDNIDLMVNYAKDVNFRNFMTKLAKKNSKLSIATKFGQNVQTGGQKISIHTIESIKEKIKFGDDYATYGEMLDQAINQAQMSDGEMSDDDYSQYLYESDSTVLTRCDHRDLSQWGDKENPEKKFERNNSDYDMYWSFSP